MKRWQTIVTLSALAVGVVSANDTVKHEGIRYIKMLGGALKKELKTHLKNDPSGLEALAFCSGSAERITDEVNAKLPKGVTVYRTALKVRNTKRNSPDATDQKVMEAYDKAVRNGKDIAKAIKVVDDGKAWRVYKPLTMQKVCLKCHGTDLDPKIAEGVKHAYPNDKATGFKLGDFRGVIVAKLPK